MIQYLHEMHKHHSRKEGVTQNGKDAVGREGHPEKGRRFSEECLLVSEPRRYAGCQDWGTKVPSRSSFRAMACGTGHREKG